MTTNEEQRTGIWIINGSHNDLDIIRLSNPIGHHKAMLKRGQFFELHQFGDWVVEMMWRDPAVEGTDRGAVKFDIKNARGSSAKAGINTGLYWPVPAPPPEPEQPEVIIHPPENSD